MSKPTLTALDRYDRMNLEAARAILADPNAIPLQVTWAKLVLGDGDDMEAQRRLPLGQTDSRTVAPSVTDADGPGRHSGSPARGTQ